MNDIKLKKDSSILFRINSRIKKALQKTAEQSGNNMTDYLENLIKSDFQRRGVQIEIKEII